MNDQEITTAAADALRERREELKRELDRRSTPEPQRPRDEAQREKRLVTDELRKRGERMLERVKVSTPQSRNAAQQATIPSAELFGSPTITTGRKA